MKQKIFGNSCIYLDGEKPNGVESTIIDLTNDTPKISASVLYTATHWRI